MSPRNLYTNINHLYTESTYTKNTYNKREVYVDIVVLSCHWLIYQSRRVSGHGYLYRFCLCFYEFSIVLWNCCASVVFYCCASVVFFAFNFIIVITYNRVSRFIACNKLGICISNCVLNCTYYISQSII